MLLASRRQRRIS